MATRKLPDLMGETLFIPLNDDQQSILVTFATGMRSWRCLQLPHLVAVSVAIKPLPVVMHMVSGPGISLPRHEAGRCGLNLF